jgi:hypothetical protein
MVVPIMLSLISILFIIMWWWIITIFAENFSIKKKINELINQPLTVEQKSELDSIQLDLDTNAYRARQAKAVVVTFAVLYILTTIALVWFNGQYDLFTYEGLLKNLKLTMLIIVLFFVPAYIGLEVVSNVEGASGDISARLKFSDELKPGEEVEV